MSKSSSYYSCISGIQVSIRPSSYLPIHAFLLGRHQRRREKAKDDRPGRKKDAVFDSFAWEMSRSLATASARATETEEGCAGVEYKSRLVSSYGYERSIASREKHLGKERK